MRTHISKCAALSTYVGLLRHLHENIGRAVYALICRTLWAHICRNAVIHRTLQGTFDIYRTLEALICRHM